MNGRSNRPRNISHFVDGKTYDECLTKAKRKWMDEFIIGKYTIGDFTNWVASSFATSAHSIAKGEERWKRERTANGRHRWSLVEGDAK